MNLSQAAHVLMEFFFMEAIKAAVWLAVRSPTWIALALALRRR